MSLEDYQRQSRQRAAESELVLKQKLEIQDYALAKKAEHGLYILRYFGIDNLIKQIEWKYNAQTYYSLYSASGDLQRALEKRSLGYQDLSYSPACTIDGLPSSFVGNAYINYWNLGSPPQPYHKYSTMGLEPGYSRYVNTSTIDDRCLGIVSRIVKNDTSGRTSGHNLIHSYSGFSIEYDYFDILVSLNPWEIRVTGSPPLVGEQITKDSIGINIAHATTVWRHFNESSG